MKLSHLIPSPFFNLNLWGLRSGLELLELDPDLDLIPPTMPTEPSGMPLEQSAYWLPYLRLQRSVAQFGTSGVQASLTWPPPDQDRSVPDAEAIPPKSSAPSVAGDPALVFGRLVVPSTLRNPDLDLRVPVADPSEEHLLLSIIFKRCLRLLIFDPPPSNVLELSEDAQLTLNFPEFLSGTLLVSVDWWMWFIFRSIRTAQYQTPARHWVLDATNSSLSCVLAVSKPLLRSVQRQMNNIRSGKTANFEVLKKPTNNNIYFWINVDKCPGLTILSEFLQEQQNKMCYNSTDKSTLSSLDQCMFSYSCLSGDYFHQNISTNSSLVSLAAATGINLHQSATCSIVTETTGSSISATVAREKWSCRAGK